MEKAFHEGQPVREAGPGGIVVIPPTPASSPAGPARAGYRGSGDAALARHSLAIWLLAQGRTVTETARLTSFVPRGIEQLLVRTNPFGPSSLGDRRRGNGAKATLLTPDGLDPLRERVKTPPDDGGVWTSRTVAAVMAAELGLAKGAEPRGWEALRAIGWTVRRDRGRRCGRVSPPNEAAAAPRPRSGPRGAVRLQRKLREAVAEEAARHPGAVIETFATDEPASIAPDRGRHRARADPAPRLGAVRAKRPVAVGHRRL